MRKLQSKQGYVLALKDKTAVYDNVVYLGIYDSPDNYIELPVEEAEKLKIELMEAVEDGNE